MQKKLPLDIRVLSQILLHFIAASARASSEGLISRTATGFLDPDNTIPEMGSPLSLTLQSLKAKCRHDQWDVFSKSLLFYFLISKLQSTTSKGVSHCIASNTKSEALFLNFVMGMWSTWRPGETSKYSDTHRLGSLGEAPHFFVSSVPETLGN